MIESRIWKRGAALVGLLAGSAAFAQPVGYDFNDDGYSDYPVSIISYDAANPDVGAARIWSGASKAIIHTIVGTDTNTLFGWSTGSAGDLDGDGKDDLIVGEPLWSTPQSQDPTFQGRLKVFSGADASTLLTINGPYVDAAIGRYVTGIGDWDGDGTIDIASSGWDIADTNSDGIGDDPIGMVFIFSGADGSVLTEIFDPASTSGFGYSVYALGDVSGDGKADIAVVDQHIETSPGSGVFGQLYIFEGSDTETAYDLSDAYRTISNTDPTIRGYAAQVDVMHPDLWLDEPTLQILNLTDLGTGGVNEAEIEIDIIKTNGVQTGTKGTRPSLKLAGDINLDGKVDAADLQDSISQLGTNPQAIGVMPIADSNGDNIIDATDIQVVVNGYGATTDIYEGLWDGSRLLSLAAGSAGFGSTSNVSIRPGGTNFGGGRRPIDDCLRSTTPPGGPTSIVPDLLRVEAADNCNSCPDCDEPDPRDCYECSQKGNVTGGEITVSPSQPEPGEQVTFTISKWQINGRKEKCNPSCGPEGTECDIDVNDRQPYWVLEKKGTNGEWVEIDDGNTATVTRTETACAELRLRLPEATIFGAVDDCDELTTTEKEKEVQWADFELEVKARAAWPSQSRSTFGPGEVAEIHLDPSTLSVGSLTWQTEPSSWTLNNSNSGTLTTPDNGVWVTLPSEPGNYTVVATSNADPSCVRRVTLEVIPPSSITYTVSYVSNVASSPCANTVQVLDMAIGPNSVNFENIYIREGLSTPANGTGSFSFRNGAIHAPGQWLSIASTGNTVNGQDASGKVARQQADGTFTGTFSWTINVHWSATGPGDPTGGEEFTTTNVTANSDPAGTVCVTKGSAGPSCKALGSGGPALPQLVIDRVNQQCGN